MPLMKKVFISPSKIVLGSGELYNLGEYISQYGERALLIAYAEDRERVRDILESSARGSGVSFIEAGFGGECSNAEVAKIIEEYRQSDIGSVIGLGGGKALDTAKIVADEQNLPMISVPTIASTDAPCSSMAIVYDDNHIIISGHPLKRSPALVLIDTQIIAQAPVRFLVSGMGDAYSTYFEARACIRSNAKSHGGVSTLSAFNLARLCYDTLLENAEEALVACRLKVVLPALENIIEANIVMSGLGFESVGLAVAHGLLGPMEMLGATKALHGEVVAFGTLVQLVMENAPEEEVRTTLDFYRKVGLPVHLKDIGIEDVTPEGLTEASKLACTKPMIHNMPFEVTPELVYASIVCADKLAAGV
jgi:glycerol dehydrogenase